MKSSAIRTWALIVIAVAGLLGATSVLGDKSLERVRDEPDDNPSPRTNGGRDLSSAC